MRFRHAVLSALCLVGIAGTAVAEEGDLIPGTFSGNVGLATDYRFRGVSQTAQKPAIQGGIDYALETGYFDTSVYVGTWASNVDFKDTVTTNPSLEIDVYGGLKGKLYGFGWQLGAIGYLYPQGKSNNDLNTLNYVEVAPALTYDVTDWLSVAVNYNWSPDFFGNTGTGNYIGGSTTIALPVGEYLKSRGVSASLNAGVGHQYIADNALFGAPDFTMWSIGGKVTYKYVSLGVAYVQTDIGRNQCFPNAAIGITSRGWCGAGVIGTLSASF